MKAIRFHEFGGTEVLQFEDVPEPTLRPDQVLVRVKACALNHLDLWVRKGLPGVKLPHINGSDVSAEIVEVGEYVTGLQVGQRVLLSPMVFCNRCAHCAAGRQNMCREFTVLGNLVDGGNRELMAVAPHFVIPVPADAVTLTWDELSSVPLVFLTAWHMLIGRCGVNPGDFVLVLGAGSGVGTAAIQIAKLHGARVIATAGDDSKLQLARDIGADFTIHHYQQKISEEVRKITWKRGADIVFEHVGSATWEESMKSLAPAGKLVTCGATTGAEARIDIRFLFVRQLSILGSYMGTMGELHQVLEHIFRGRLKPVVDKSFPLREARAAHQRLEKSQQFGKIVLNP